jgi:SPP1 gp7 family putative phage head morphogenesis protein
MTTAVGLKAVDDVLHDDAFWEEQRQQFLKVATDLVSKSLAQGVGREMQLGVNVNPDQINQAVLDYAAKYTNDWWDQLSTSTQDQLRAAIENNIQTGEPTSALIKDLEPIFGENRAQAIAVTETTRMYADTAILAARDAGVDTMVWQTAEDQLVCDECGGNDGEEYAIDEVPDCPAHPNCLPGDTLVASGGGITAVSKRVYRGDLVVIKTASGNSLSCTPNHPILTDCGWLPARLLDEGANVVSSLVGNYVGLSDIDHEHVPASIHDVTETFRRLPHVFTTPMPVTAPDFHGDGEGSEVAVIWADGLLRNSLDAFNFEKIFEDRFVGSRFAEAFERGSMPTALVERTLASTCSGVRSSALPLSSSSGHLTPLQKLGFLPSSNVSLGFLQKPSNNKSTDSEALSQGQFGRSFNVQPSNIALHDDSSMTSWSDGNSCLPQATRDGAPASDPNLASDLIARFPGVIALDKVVSIEVVPFSGHVYNLQTETNWYVAAGIITHNCRCWLSPSVNGDALDTPLSDEEYAAQFGDVGEGESALSDVLLSSLVLLALKDWNEELHPRDDHGRFAEAGSAPAVGTYAEYEHMEALMGNPDQLGYAGATEEDKAREFKGAVASHLTDALIAKHGDELVGLARTFGRDSAGKVVLPSGQEILQKAAETPGGRLGILNGEPVLMTADGHNAFGGGPPDIHSGLVPLPDNWFSKVIPTSDLEGCKRALAEAGTSTLIGRWAGTANDQDARSLAMQETAAKEFGIKGAAGWDLSGGPSGLSAEGRAERATEMRSSIDADLKTNEPLYRDFLRAQYDDTQKMFRDAGITKVELSRGFDIRPPDRGLHDIGFTDPPSWAKNGDRTEVPLRPLSSFAYVAAKANNFGNWRFDAYVPISRILSTPRTGFGCLREKEVVVLGGPLAGRGYQRGSFTQDWPAWTTVYGSSKELKDINHDWNEDWLKTLTWDVRVGGVLVTTPEALATFLDGKPLAEFMKLPAAQAMPKGLRTAAKDYDEAKHPRIPAGSPEGGQFAPQSFDEAFAASWRNDQQRAASVSRVLATRKYDPKSWGVTVPAPWTASKADVQAGKIPGVKYLEGQGTSGTVMARADIGTGTIGLYDHFFEVSDQGLKQSVMDHEVDHEVQYVMTRDGSGEALLAPYKTDRPGYFSAPWSPNPRMEEVLAYAADEVKRPSYFEDFNDPYVQKQVAVFNEVATVARELGHQVDPSWPHLQIGQKWRYDQVRDEKGRWVSEGTSKNPDLHSHPRNGRVMGSHSHHRGRVPHDHEPSRWRSGKLAYRLLNPEHAGLAMSLHPAYGKDAKTMDGTADDAVLEALAILGLKDFDESKHPRDEHGKFTDSGAVREAAGRAIIAAAVARQPSLAEETRLAEEAKREARRLDAVGTVTVYHGTTLAAAKAEIHDGIREQFAGHNFSASKQYVYVTTKKDTAMMFGAMVAGEKDAKQFAIIEAKVPADKLWSDRNLIDVPAWTGGPGPDRPASIYQSFETEDVKPEQITRVEIYDMPPPRAPGEQPIYFDVPEEALKDVPIKLTGVIEGDKLASWAGTKAKMTTVYFAVAVDVAKKLVGAAKEYDEAPVGWKFNPNHDDLGRFAAADSVNLDQRLVDYKPDRSLSDPSKTVAITKIVPGSEVTKYSKMPFLDQLHAEMGVENPATIPIQDYMAKRDAFFAKQPVVEVPLRNLVLTQLRVNEERVREIAKDPSKAKGLPPFAVHHDGETYILNGHHRVAAEIANGEKTMRMHLWNADAMKEFDEAKHPRAPSGSSEGGQFVAYDAGERFGASILDLKDSSYLEVQNQFLSEVSPAKRTDFTGDARGALDDYKGVGDHPFTFKGMNRYLRGKTNTISKQRQKIIDGLDKAFNQAKGIDRDLTVYRAVDPRFLPNVDVGSVIKDKGFGSTSLVKQIDELFGTHGNRDGARMTIDLPRGTKAIWMESAPTPNVVHERTEQELLLPRDQQFQVVSKDENGVRLRAVG